MSHAYDELSGSRGSKIFFRSRRYRARDLITRVPATLIVDNQPQDLRDLSMNGLSFFATSGGFDIGATCSLSLRLDAAEVYRGEGIISRLEMAPRGSVVGVRLVRGFLDIPRLVGQHDELSLRRDLLNGAAVDLELVPRAYRTLCAEMLFVLRHYRSLCERTIKSMGKRGRHEIRDETLFEYYESLEAEWTPLRKRAEQLIVGLRPGTPPYRATKRFTEELLTPEFQDGVAGYRGYQKPLGYPGDFILMNAFYAQELEGKTAYGKLLHLLIARFPLAACVTPRMEMLADAITATVEKASRDSSTRAAGVRIASLGSGPAREVESYLKSHSPDRPLHFVLIDQDEGALSYAYNQVYPLVARLDNGSSVECLHIAFAQMLKDPSVLDSLPPQDLVYSAGLVDYLTDPIATRIFAMLYSQLRPGGTLVVGNMADNPGIGWLPEFLLDWTLLYRSEEEMKSFADQLGAASVEVRLDRTGYTYLAYIESPS